jgi:hypothetical protein
MEVFRYGGAISRKLTPKVVPLADPLVSTVFRHCILELLNVVVTQAHFM